MTTINELLTNFKNLVKKYHYTKTEVDTALAEKAGKDTATTSVDGLMSAADKTKLEGIESGATATTIDSSLSSSSENPVQNKVIKEALDTKATASSLATVATTGSYSDLGNIPETFTPSSHTHGSITNDGKVGTASGKPLITGTGGLVSAGEFGSSAGQFAEGNHTHSQYLTEHQDISGKANSADLSTVATTGDYDDLLNKPTIPVIEDIYEITSNKGTASADTMNKLYIEVDGDERDVYYTEEDNGTYSWHKLDTDILDDLSIDWNDVQDKPTFSTVATSGSYVDLSNKPEIPPLQVITEGTAITEDGIYLEIPAPAVLTLTVDTTETEGIFTPHDYPDTTQGLIGTNMIINWGDGTTESLASNAEFPGHEYNEAGTYNITVSGVTSIGKDCFYSCTNLRNVIIPSTVTTIGETAFYYCWKMTNIVMLEGVTTLGNYCFSECSGLLSLTVPSTVTSFGEDCFAEAEYITDYQLYWTGENIIEHDSTHFDDYYTENVVYTIPNGETSNYIAKGYPSAKLQERSA